MAFFHWNIHGKKNYIYTIQNAILLIYLFGIASSIGDGLSYNKKFCFLEIIINIAKFIPFENLYNY